MRQATTETPLSNAVLIPRERIWVDAQAREYFDPTQLKELSESIRAHGILQPLLVRYEPSRYDGKLWKLLAGERRFRASEGIRDELPCIVNEAGEGSAKVLSLVENLQRADLTALEEAKGLADLIQSQNLSARRAARVLHVSDGWVNNRLSLLKTKPDVQAVAAKAPLAMSSLLLIDTVNDKSLRADLLEQVSGGASHSQIKSRVELFLQERKRSRQSTHAPDAQTQNRLTAYESNGVPNMSRGRRVTGTTAQEARGNAIEALRGVETKIDTLAHWWEALTPSQRRVLVPQVAKLKKRLDELVE